MDDDAVKKDRYYFGKQSFRSLLCRSTRFRVAASVAGCDGGHPVRIILIVTEPSIEWAISPLAAHVREGLPPEIAPRQLARVSLIWGFIYSLLYRIASDMVRPLEETQNSNELPSKFGGICGESCNSP